jgi:hypothetical protein
LRTSSVTRVGGLVKYFNVDSSGFIIDLIRVSMGLLDWRASVWSEWRFILCFLIKLLKILAKLGIGQ